MARTAVTFLGSGDAFNAGGRGHSCYLIEDALGPCAVDFGPTALMALRRLGKDPSALDSVLITHLHGDHFAGLPFLFIDGAFRTRGRRPLTIAGPPGVEERVRTLVAACYRDVLRSPPPFELRFVEWSDNRELEVAGRRMLPIPAFHQDLPDRAYSLRLESGGATLAFTGDTGWSDELVPLAAGADLFVAECSLWSPGYDRHLGRAEWERLLPQLNCRIVAVTHLGDEVLAHRAELLDLRRPPRTLFVFGEDLLRLEI